MLRDSSLFASRELKDLIRPPFGGHLLHPDSYRERREAARGFILLITIVIRFERTLLSYTNILRLFRRKNVQLNTNFLKVQASNFLI